jgi:hypothetical protein
VELWHHVHCELRRVAHAIASCFVVLGLGYGIERRARELIHALIWTMFRVCVCVCVWAWAFECMIDMGWKILHMIWKVLGHPPISRLPVRIPKPAALSALKARSRSRRLSSQVKAISRVGSLYSKCETCSLPLRSFLTCSTRNVGQRNAMTRWIAERE